MIFKGILRKRVREKALLQEVTEETAKMQTEDGRTVVFADEPDIAFYQDDQIQAAVEIKGGIDPAGVLERIGAAFKSLQRVREENPRSTTILILQGVSLTQKAKHDLEINRHGVTGWFTVEDVLENESRREHIFRFLGI